MRIPVSKNPIPVTYIFILFILLLTWRFINIFNPKFALMYNIEIYAYV